MRATRLSLILLAALASTLAAAVAAAALEPDHYVVYLLPGQGGFQLKYTGYVPNCSDLRIYPVQAYGFKPVIVTRSCSGGYLELTVRLDGSYDGTRGEYTPVIVYSGGGRVDVSPVRLEPVRVDSVSCTVARVYGLTVTPSSPRVGDTILVAPRAVIRVDVSLSDSPTFPAVVVLRAGGGEARVTVTGATFSATVSGVVAGAARVEVLVGGRVVYATQCSVGDAPGAVLELAPVYPSVRNGREVYVGTVTVSATNRVTIRVSLSPGGGTVTITKPGVYEVYTNVKAGGYTYTVTVTPASGSPVSFTVSSRAPGRVSVGRLAANVILATFAVAYIASLVTMILGVATGNPGLIPAGMLGGVASFTILMSLVAAVAAAKLFIAVGAPDPAGVSSLTFTNLPLVFNRAVEYVSGEARILAARTLQITAGAIATAAGGYAVGSFLAGLIGLATAGAGSIAGGIAIGQLIANLITIAILGAVAAAVLNALGGLYPVLVAAALIVSYALALVKLVASALSGNPSAAVNVAVDLATIVAAVLITPSLFALLEVKLASRTIPVTLGPFHFEIPLDPAMYVVVTFLEAALLGAILGLLVSRAFGLGRM